jgi:hypothetical protein
MTVAELVERTRRAGGALTLKEDGLVWVRGTRRLEPDFIDLLRAHTEEIREYLRAAPVSEARRIVREAVLRRIITASSRMCSVCLRLALCYPLADKGFICRECAREHF